MFTHPLRHPVFAALVVVVLLVASGAAVEAQTNIFPADGNVGIGTTTPQAPLEIQTSGTTNFLWDNGKARLQGSKDTIVTDRAQFRILLDADNNEADNTESFELYQNMSSVGYQVLPEFHLSFSDGKNSYFRPAGRFGIGTNQPVGALHVFDPVSTGTSDHLDLLFDGEGSPNGLALDGAITGNWAREFKIMTGGSGTLFGMGALVDSSAQLVRGYIGGNSTQNSVYDIPWVTFLPDGKVGIGTLSPASLLSVAGTVESTTGGFKFPDGTIQLSAASGTASSLDASDGSPTDVVYVDAVGNVGVGTLAPTSKLSVVGTIESTLGGIRFPDGTLQTTAASSSSSDAYGASSSAPSNSVYVTNYGYVGIGEQYPGSKLTVSGAVESTNGGFVFPDGTVQMTAGGGHSLSAADGQPAEAVYVDTAGNVGIGTTAPLTALDVRGTTTTYTLEVTGGSDLSESFDVAAEEKILPGMVVAIDPERPGGLRLSHEKYDRMVVGVVSGAGGVQPGLVMGQAGTLAAGGHPIALTGRVYVLADTSNGPIRPGDLLTTSSAPGHAMRVVDHEQADGSILGKAMTGLDEGQGQVLVLVALQ